MHSRSTACLFTVAITVSLRSAVAAEQPSVTSDHVTDPVSNRSDDPLAPILRPALKSSVQVMLDRYRTGRRYTDADFPMASAPFEAFRRDITRRLVKTLGLEAWTVRRPVGKQSPLAGRFKDRLLKRIRRQGMEMEVHAVAFPATGAVVPMVVCLPEGDGKRPGVCLFSGHSRHGLRDLVLDLDSYQAGMAVRLARAGFATIAVEKVDAGYLSRDGRSGVDEQEIATLRLAWGRVTRAHQLMACLAASEILATHPRVDATRIGAAGVSLGGWLSTQTALLSDRIRAVADFGVKTQMVPPGVTPNQFQGLRDLCHILPGMLSVCDRNLLGLAYCPRPLLAGHGRQDGGSAREAPVHYRQLYRRQYERLGHADRFQYHVHDGGDVMPADAVITWFEKQFLSGRGRVAADIDHLQGEMVGELDCSSAILQSRLTAPYVADDGDLPGRRGVARFELAESTDFANSRLTPWLEAVPDHDFVVKTRVAGLRPATRYTYRLEYGVDQNSLRRGPARSFRTHHAADEVAGHRFVVVTGMNYAYFHHGLHRDGAPDRQEYQGSDKNLGYPALASILALRPDFFVGTGDNVYYDAPRGSAARTPAAMRKKWHQQFVQPRFVDLFARVPTYWEKDDHDYRYDDCDNTGDRLPSVAWGRRIFREQVPITDPRQPQAVTYRTYRPGKLLQFWLVENRDYRSPNRSPDRPEKTLWGRRQREWLKRTLLASDATFKIIISPTPMIGPDDLRKRDNHCDLGGFRQERDAFFAWARRVGLLEKGLYLICGDRHWQYHAVHPTGLEEFSCGALVDANARLGVKPGDPRSTDPEATILQPYTSGEPSGGFLLVEIEADRVTRAATVRFNFYDERGTLLYTAARQRRLDANRVGHAPHDAIEGSLIEHATSCDRQT